MTVGQLGHVLGRRCGRVVEKKGNIQGNGPGYVGLGHDGGDGLVGLYDWIRHQCLRYWVGYMSQKQKALSGTSS